MKFFRRHKLNSKGFSHVELGFIIIVLIGIGAVGYYVYKHDDNAKAANTYTSLANITADGHTFTEEACITAQLGTGSTQTDVVNAVMSVNTKTSSVPVRQSGRHSRKSNYDPLAYYTINGGAIVTENSWVSGSTSTISFNLPASTSTSTFQLGVEAIPGKTTTTAGSSQTIGSITLCNPAPTPAPVVTVSASPASISSGASSTLTWTATNATSCTASGAWSGSQDVSGSASTGDLTATSTYDLSCTGAGGTGTASTIVTVTAVVPPTSTIVTTTDSKSNCIEMNNPNGDIDDAQVSAITAITGVTYNCVITYNSGMPSWTAWEEPWMLTGGYGWNSWLAESPSHQIVLGQDLIPNTLENNSDPLTWEQECDAGDFNSYATAFGQYLVNAGAANTVIRLGIEANGGWEIDYVGSTTQEQNAWAQCYDQEVTAIRAVPGNSFLFVWNPNICTSDAPLNEWYPGNSYVDIIGADAYDEDCNTTKTVAEEGWSAYYNDSSNNTPNNPNFPSLANIVSFAAANGKPFAIPEWGEWTTEADDPSYVTNMGDLVNDNDTSFQSWFDCGCDGTQPLGPAIPLSTSAYSEAF